MRYTEFTGRSDDYVEYRSIKPKYHPCSQCNKKGKRKQVIRRRISHVGALNRRTWEHQYLIVRKAQDLREKEDAYY